jgi:hypothetical protein
VLWWQGSRRFQISDFKKVDFQQAVSNKRFARGDLKQTILKQTIQEGDLRKGKKAVSR